MPRKSRARRSGETTERARREAFLALPPAERIEKLGHRAYVGGTDPEMWYGIGRLQFHRLVAEGLRPHHDFLDVGCGSLRLGQFLIPYLDEGRYYGLEAERRLVELGQVHELHFDLVRLKKPQFGFNDGFDVGFVPGFDYAMAQSVLTHLDLEDIARCFSRIARAARPGASFLFTYFEGSEAENPTAPSNPHRVWYYPFERIAELAAAAGWHARRIGDWGHPRDQMLAIAERGAG